MMMMMNSGYHFLAPKNLVKKSSSLLDDEQWGVCLMVSNTKRKVVISLKHIWKQIDSK
jgi:hypothetical protein